MKIELSKVVLMSFVNVMNIDTKSKGLTKQEVADKYYIMTDLFESCIKYGSNPKYTYTFYPLNESKYPEELNKFIKELQNLEKHAYVEKRERNLGAVMGVSVDTKRIIEYRLTAKGKDKIRELFTRQKA